MADIYKMLTVVGLKKILTEHDIEIPKGKLKKKDLTTLYEQNVLFNNSKLSTNNTTILTNNNKKRNSNNVDYSDSDHDDGGDSDDDYVPKYKKTKTEKQTSLSSSLKPSPSIVQRSSKLLYNSNTNTNPSVSSESTSVVENSLCEDKKKHDVRISTLGIDIAVTSNNPICCSIMINGVTYDINTEQKQEKEQQIKSKETIIIVDGKTKESESSTQTAMPKGLLSPAYSGKETKTYDTENHNSKKMVVGVVNAKSKSVASPRVENKKRLFTRNITAIKTIRVHPRSTKQSIGLFQ